MEGDSFGFDDILPEIMISGKRKEDHRWRKKRFLSKIYPIVGLNLSPCHDSGIPCLWLVTLPIELLGQSSDNGFHTVLNVNFTNDLTNYISNCFSVFSGVTIAGVHLHEQHVKFL